MGKQCVLLLSDEASTMSATQFVVRVDDSCDVVDIGGLVAPGKSAGGTMKMKCKWF